MSSIGCEIWDVAATAGAAAGCGANGDSELAAAGRDVAVTAGTAAGIFSFSFFFLCSSPPVIHPAVMTKVITADLNLTGCAALEQQVGSAALEPIRDPTFLRGGQDVDNINNDKVIMHALYEPVAMDSGMLVAGNRFYSLDQFQIISCIRFGLVLSHSIYMV